jgi:hypothetical protein
MKELREVFVIYNPEGKDYYVDNSFGPIMFAKHYNTKELVLVDVDRILKKSKSNKFLHIEKMYTYK